MEITKEIMQQYETIRQSGVTNMFNVSMVRTVASRAGFHELGCLSTELYGQLLMNFAALMEEFGVTQDPIPKAEEIRKQWNT